MYVFLQNNINEDEKKTWQLELKTATYKVVSIITRLNYELWNVYRC